MANVKTITTPDGKKYDIGVAYENISGKPARAGSAIEGGPASSVANSLKIQLNGGTNEGTDQFTYNGSTTKSVNITASSVGALATDGKAKSAETADKVNGHTVNADVPANAKFTDTNTWNALKGSTATVDGSAGYAPAPAKGDANRYLRCDGTWASPPNDNTHKTWGLSINGHTVSIVDGGTNKSVTVPDENTKYASTVKSVTLSANSWSSSNAYTISDSLITATSFQEILPAIDITKDQVIAYGKANIQDGGQKAGSLTLTCLGTKPTIDIPIRVIYRGTI